MNISEKFSTLINAVEGGNKAAFARKVGKTPQYIHKIIKDGNNPSIDMASNICSAYPHVSTDWLLTGDGEMFKDDRKVELASVDPETERKPGYWKGKFEAVMEQLSDYREREKQLLQMLAGQLAGKFEVYSFG